MPTMFYAQRNIASGNVFIPRELTASRSWSTMDVYVILNELYAERRRIDRVLARLENRQRAEARNSFNRGRKSMSAEERARVSERMRAYWSARRRQASLRD